ncbi:MAG: hypothetical protein M1831_005938 [Alyxoria varia]|nr:MAG: hypothetical protein M1831_005938 [Alyxoria varia]
MDKLKNMLSPGHEDDDSKMYGTGTARDGKLKGEGSHLGSSSTEQPTRSNPSNMPGGFDETPQYEKSHGDLAYPSSNTTNTTGTGRDHRAPEQDAGYNQRNATNTTGLSDDASTRSIKSGVIGGGGAYPDRSEHTGPTGSTFTGSELPDRTVDRDNGANVSPTVTDRSYHLRGTSSAHEDSNESMRDRPHPLSSHSPPEHGHGDTRGLHRDAQTGPSTGTLGSDSGDRSNLGRDAAIGGGAGALGAAGLGAYSNKDREVGSSGQYMGQEPSRGVTAGDGTSYQPKYNTIGDGTPSGIATHDTRTAPSSREQYGQASGPGGSKFMGQEPSTGVTSGDGTSHQPKYNTIGHGTPSGIATHDTTTKPSSREQYGQASGPGGSKFLGQEPSTGVTSGDGTSYQPKYNTIGDGTPSGIATHDTTTKPSSREQYGQASGPGGSKFTEELSGGSDDGRGLDKGTGLGAGAATAGAAGLGAYGMNREGTHDQPGSGSNTIWTSDRSQNAAQKYEGHDDRRHHDNDTGLGSYGASNRSTRDEHSSLIDKIKPSGSSTGAGTNRYETGDRYDQNKGTGVGTGAGMGAGAAAGAAGLGAYGASQEGARDEPRSGYGTSREGARDEPRSGIEKVMTSGGPTGAGQKYNHLETGTPSGIATDDPAYPSNDSSRGVGTGGLSRSDLDSSRGTGIGGLPRSDLDSSRGTGTGGLPRSDLDSSRGTGIGGLPRSEEKSHHYGRDATGAGGIAGAAGLASSGREQSKYDGTSSGPPAGRTQDPGYATRTDYGSEKPPSSMAGTSSHHTSSNTTKHSDSPSSSSQKDHGPAGPHSSGLLNKLDPRVTSDAEKVAAQQQKEQQSSGLPGYGGSGAATGATTGAYGASSSPNQYGDQGYGGAGVGTGPTAGTYGTPSSQNQYAGQGYGGAGAATGPTAGAYGTSSSQNQYAHQQPLGSTQATKGYDSTGSGLAGSTAQPGYQSQRSPPVQYAGTGSAPDYSPGEETSSGRYQQTSHSSQTKPLAHGDTTAAGTRQAPDYSNNPEYTGGPSQFEQGQYSGTTSSTATGGEEKKGGLMGFLHRDNPNKLHKDPPAHE